MALEVEMKAHIGDPEAIGRRLRAAGFVAAGKIDKDDRYCRSANGVEFRVRFRGTNGGDSRRPRTDARESAGDVRGPMPGAPASASAREPASRPAPGAGESRPPSSAVVTHKRKQIREGVERNLEWEFEVSDASAFEALCERMGCERFAVKRKRGSVFRRGSLFAEVVEVERLGWFVEIECMVEGGDGEHAAGQIRDTLEAIGVDARDVESRSYLQLLGFER